MSAPRCPQTPQSARPMFPRKHQSLDANVSSKTSKHHARPCTDQRVLGHIQVRSTEWSRPCGARDSKPGSASSAQPWRTEDWPHRIKSRVDNAGRRFARLISLEMSHRDSPTQARVRDVYWGEAFGRWHLPSVPFNGYSRPSPVYGSISCQGDLRCS